MKIGKQNQRKVSQSKRKPRGADYQAKCETGNNRYGDVMWRKDQKCDVFKNAKMMISSCSSLNTQGHG